MRRLGVDPGSVRVGLALSDEGGVLASPFTTLPGGAGAGLPERIAQVVREQGVAEVVIGLPLRLDGGEGGAARRARALGAAVASSAGVPVVLWDERLTTRAADRALASAGVRREARRAKIDRAAAVVLLQSYLDAKRGPGWDGADG